MSVRTRILRALAALVVVAVFVVAGFWIVGQFIPTWGATPQEVARTLPGDEIVATPLVNWTHAITLNAPSEQVWGWVAQIGERRGAFYSYTFIENQMGNGDVYHNAERIVPEWQNPTPGTVLIQNAMALDSLERGKWYLGSSTNEMGWTWLWFLEPINAQQTRLIVRSHIQPPGEMSNPVVGAVLTFGGFVMEQGMLQGIQARAEGNAPPSYTEPVEIVLWVVTFLAALVAGILFVWFKEWLLPLAAMLLAIVALFAFTFIQPPIWMRLLADVTLFAVLAGIGFDQSLRRPRAVSSKRPGALKLKPSALK